MDFAGMIETWRKVLTQPGEEVFRQEQANPNGTLTTGVIWMVIAGVAAGVFGLIQGAVGANSMQAMMDAMGDLPLEVRQQMAQLMGPMLGGVSLLSIITVPVFFLIGTFITHLLATAFGGRGDYGKFAYLAATFQSPIVAANAAIAIVPVLGGCVVFLVSIYSYVLAYYAVRVNYNLTSGRAIAVLLIPFALLVLLMLCVGLAVGMLVINAS